MRAYKEKIYATLNGDQKLRDLLGGEEGRIFPIFAKNPPLPYLVYHSINYPKSSANSKFGTIDTVDTVVEVVSKEYDNVLRLADRVRTILEQQAKVKFTNCQEGRTQDGDYHVQTLQFNTDFKFKETED